MPHTSRLIPWYDEESSRVKIATHAKFDEGFNDLPADTLPPNCQQILRHNGTKLPTDKNEISSSQLEFFVHPFLEKETVTIPVLPNNKDDNFGFQLRDDELFSRTFIERVKDTKTSSAAKTFGNFKQSQRKFRGAFITHIDGDPVFSTDQAAEKLRILFNKWKEEKEKVAHQGVVPQFLFDITFACKEQTQNKLVGRRI